jgi:hypothetical protein
MKPEMQDTAPLGRKKDLAQEYKPQVKRRGKSDNPMLDAQMHRAWRQRENRKRQKRLDNERARKQLEREASSDDAEFWC